MNKITEKEFFELAKESLIEQYFDISDTFEQLHDYTDDGEEIFRSMVCGYIWRTITVKGCEFTYTNYFQYPEYKASEVEISESNAQNYWSKTGEELVVIDEDGDEIDFSWLYDKLIEETMISNFDESVFGDDELEEVDNDNDKENDMKEYIVQRSNAADLRFNGEIVAHTESSANNASGSSYSGQTGRWSELTLYKTAGGKYVCAQIGRTQWQGEHDRYSGDVCETVQDVIAFFGHGWLAKDLYEIAEIEDIEEVE